MSDLLNEIIETVDTEETTDIAIVGEVSELPAVHEPKVEQNAITMWNNVELFENTQRMAKLLAVSNIAPQQYRGNIADCVVAIDIANRMGLSPLVVMQNSQIVHGNFSWKGTATKAMIDSCKKYTKTRYVEVGERGKDSWGFYLEAIDKDGEIVKGVTVDIAMAKKEGWWQRNPKWANLTELMLKYRASAFFMRTECAGLAMGFLTSEENEDVYNSKHGKTNNVVEILDDEIKGE